MAPGVCALRRVILGRCIQRPSHRAMAPRGTHRPRHHARSNIQILVRGRRPIYEKLGKHLAFIGLHSSMTSCKVRCHLGVRSWSGSVMNAVIAEVDSMVTEDRIARIESDGVEIKG